MKPNGPSRSRRRPGGARNSSGRVPDDNSRWRFGTSPATPTVLSMTPTRPSGGVFGITCNTLVRSSQRPYVGLYFGAWTAAGWGEDCWSDRAADIIAALERSESLPRYSHVIAHMHTSHAPPLEPNKVKIGWRN